MNLVILTAEDMYYLFLDGIRKMYNTTVKPDVFNRIINDSQLDWVKGKLPQAEFNQKRIDDIEVLRVVTDGGSMYASYDILSDVGDYIFDIPTLYSTITSGSLLSNINGVNYPLYLHGLNAMFKKRDGDTWLRARIRRSDRTVMLDDNPFRSPSDDRLYFEQIKNQIRLIGGEYDNLRLEYYRYPRIITYSATELSNIDPEFNPGQNKEIVEIAVKTYIERTTDPRYKSFLQEMMIRSQGQ